MLDCLAKIMTEVTCFTNKHRIEAQFFLHEVQELKEGGERQNERWKKFEQQAGVYCLFDRKGQSVKYIGMSERDTGGRVFHWLFPKENQETKLQLDIKKKDIILHIVLKSEPYMASSLETFLIQNIETLHNVKKLTRQRKN